MQSVFCEDGCCKLQYIPVRPTFHPRFRQRRHRRKAGACLYDSTSQKVLLVQSRGHMWGFPKGTMEEDETPKGAALREVKEETGLTIPAHLMLKRLNASDRRSHYFFIPYPERHVLVQKDVVHNDANGIGWIKIKCLEKLIQKGRISLNRNALIILERYFDLVRYPPPLLLHKNELSSRYIFKNTYAP